ncbi:MAG: cation:H+ antiporter [Gammaproteobacteria bacterium]|jgi:cation:H+ antiporter
MLLSVSAIVFGLMLLVWSADKFVEGASSLAHHFGVSPLIIGITIIGFGTSAPEILVSIIAVMEDTPDIAIGNALGSNIANIGLILGVTAFITPVPIAKALFKREYPLLIIATAILAWCLIDGSLNQIDGLTLLLALLAILVYLIKSHRNNPNKNGIEDELSKTIPENMTLISAIIWSLVGLTVLVGSSKILVWGATDIALALGVSELIIGLTVIALGTSLPELAASIASLKKGVPDMAIGNIIGSNLFNSLAVIGIPALVTDFSINAHAVSRDLPVVVGLTILLLCFSFFPASSNQSLTRIKGLCLLCCFVIYQLYLYYSIMVGDT